MTGSNELLQHQLHTGAVTSAPAVTGPVACQVVHPPVTHFGDAAAEYKAAQESAAIFDVSDRVQIEFSGKDARTFLHNLCSNDIKRLTPGNGCEAFITNVKGRILAHVFAFVTEDAVWVDSPPTNEETFLAHFDRYLFNEDVSLHNRTQTFGDLYISGMESSAPLAATGLAVNTLAKMQHTMGTILGIPVVVRRVDLWGQRGFVLSVNRQHVVEIWQHLVEAGAQPAGAQAFHSLRIEAGFPIHGIDLSSENLAQEAGRTELAISFTKGCYLGQEPIARIDALGHINRQVTRLRLETESVLPTNAPITTPDGVQAGVLTSSMAKPGDRYCVALAMLKTTHAQPGTALTVRNDSEAIAATVL